MIAKGSIHGKEGTDQKEKKVLMTEVMALVLKPTKD